MSHRTPNEPYPAGVRGGWVFKEGVSEESWRIIFLPKKLMVVVPRMSLPVLERGEVESSHFHYPSSSHSYISGGILLVP